MSDCSLYLAIILGSFQTFLNTVPDIALTTIVLGSLGGMMGHLSNGLPTLEGDVVTGGEATIHSHVLLGVVLGLLANCNIGIGDQLLVRRVVAVVVVRYIILRKSTGLVTLIKPSIFLPLSTSLFLRVLILLY